MTLLNQLVRNLVVLVIVMTFLEMLLPENKMRNYARLIFGLMIIATILNPIVVILTDLGRMEFSEFAFSGEIDIGDQDEIQEIYNQLTVDQYILNLEEKTEQLVFQHVEGYEVKAVVDIDSDFDSKNFGKIIAIDIYLKKECDGIKPVKPVLIGPMQQQKQEQHIEFQQSDVIKKAICEYFHISQSIVNVHEIREEG